MNDIILACIHINRQSIFKQSTAVVIGILQNGKLKDDTVKSIGPIGENGKLILAKHSKSIIDGAIRTACIRRIETNFMNKLNLNI